MDNRVFGHGRHERIYDFAFFGKASKAGHAVRFGHQGTDLQPSVFGFFLLAMANGQDMNSALRVTLEQQFDQGVVDAFDTTGGGSSDGVWTDQGQVQAHGFTEAISGMGTRVGSFMADRVLLQD